MSKLSKLYTTIESLKELNLPIDELLQQEVDKLEEDLIRTEILPTLTDKIEPALAQVQRELVLVVDYVPGEPLKVSLSRKRNIADVLTDAVEISPKRPHVVTATDITRSPNIDFRVRFEDGTVCEGNGKSAFIEALKHMVLPRVATFDGRTFAGFPLVGRKQRVTEDGYKWQEYVDGWWIYVNMSNETKMSMLKQVANALGQSITIDVLKDSDTKPDKTKSEGKPKGKRTLYSIDKGTPMNKRATVYAVIEKYLYDNDGISVDEIEKVFPKYIQGSYGVIATEKELSERRKKGLQVNNRYFIDRPLYDGYGTTFYVCHQWGDENFDRFCSRVREELDWYIEEVPDKD